MWWLLLWMGCSTPEPRPPDLVVLSVDTLRWDRLGYAGHGAAHTPHLDALAARGRVFTMATTPLPRTTPALASLQTGLRPHRHGSQEVGDPMEAETTLATLLQARGWATHGVSAIRVAGPEQKLDRGFSTFSVLHDARADAVTEAALAQARATRARDPLYLWVHYADPHFPYLPPEDAPLAVDGGRCRALGERSASGAFKRIGLFTDREGLATAVRSQCLALYDAEISVVDRAIGALLAGLRELDRPDPLVVFTADHGENQGEDGLFFEHGPNVHDASMRIPLVMAGAGIPPGTDTGVARLEDLLPTALGWLGLGDQIPAALDGVDLSGRLRGEAGGPEWAVTESGSPLHLGLHDYPVSGRRTRYCYNGERFSWCRLGRRTGLFDRQADPSLSTDVSAEHPERVAAFERATQTWQPEGARQRTVRGARWKLVARPMLSGGYQRSLYDTEADPLAIQDVSEAQPEMMERLGAVLDGWQGELGDPEITPRDEDDLELLRALGYVEEAP